MREAECLACKQEGRPRDSLRRGEDNIRREGGSLRREGGSLRREGDSPRKEAGIPRREGGRHPVPAWEGGRLLPPSPSMAFTQEERTRVQVGCIRAQLSSTCQSSGQSSF